MFWEFPFSVDLPARRATGQGRYLGDMSIFRPESVRLVEQALIEGPTEGMTGKQVWEATKQRGYSHCPTASMVLRYSARNTLMAL